MVKKAIKASPDSRRGNVTGKQKGHTAEEPMGQEIQLSKDGHNNQLHPTSTTYCSRHLGGSSRWSRGANSQEQRGVVRCPKPDFGETSIADGNASR